MVWACYEKRGALCRKAGDGNESTGRRKRGRPKRRWLDRVRGDIKEKGLSAEEVYDRATWRRTYIAPHKRWNKMKGGTHFVVWKLIQDDLAIRVGRHKISAIW